MAAYGLSVTVDRVLVDFQRSKTSNEDNDWLTLVVQTKKDGRTLSVSAYQLGDSITSGTELSNIAPPIVVDGLLLSEDDELLISCFITNMAYTGDPWPKALVLAGAVISAVGWAEIALGDYNDVVIAVKEGKWLQVVAAVVAGIGQFLHSTDCDGQVFSRVFPPRSVAQVVADTNGQVGRSFTFPLDPYTERNSTGCGHDPVTRVAVSVNLTSADPDLAQLPPGSVGPPGPVVNVRSAPGAPPAAWDGQWVDHNARVRATVQSVVSALPAPDADSIGGWLARQVGAESGLAMAAAGPGEMPMTPASQDPVAQLPSHFVLDISETITWFEGTREVANSSSLAFAFPTDQPARDGDRYAPGPGIVKGPPGGLRVDADLGGGSIQIVPGVGPGDPEGGGGSIQIVPGVGGTPAVGTPTGANLASSISVAPGVSLSMWAGYDAQNRFVTYLVRYLRLDGDGAPETDVMLSQPTLIR